MYPVGIYGVMAERLTVRDATRYTITGCSSRSRSCPATYRSRVGRRLAGQLAFGDQVKGSPANGDEAIHVRVVRDLRYDARGVSTTGGRGHDRGDGSNETKVAFNRVHKTMCFNTSTVAIERCKVNRRCQPISVTHR